MLKKILEKITNVYKMCVSYFKVDEETIFEDVPVMEEDDVTEPENNYCPEIEIKNQECYDIYGRKLFGWLSRSVSATLFTFVKGNNDSWYVLASQRGIGTPDPEYHGCWNAPCGYLDYNETLENTAKRETHEETGVDVDINNINFYGLDSNPNNDKRQNVKVYYYTILNNRLEDIERTITSNNSELNEVITSSFIRVDDINRFKWAFCHDTLINEIYNTKIK